MTGVITGSGMERAFPLSRPTRVRTKFGEAALYLCSTGRTEFYLLPRHGKNHEVPPHRIDFRANLSALSAVGVRNVVATSAVGSISKKLQVGGFGLLDQFIDMSKRHVTFFDSAPGHTDMTRPYDRRMQDVIARAASAKRLNLVRGLTYVSVDGPRYETAAEIRAFGMLGGDVVGMTGAPEAILANEVGLKYASIVVATNWAAGIQEKVSHDEVVALMKDTTPKLRSLIEIAVDAL